jgi:hypothetical protein
MFIPDLHPPIPDPGFRGQKGTGSGSTTLVCYKFLFSDGINGSNRHSFSGSFLFYIVHFSQVSHFEAMLWIRIGFNADPDPAFYLIADPEPGQTFMSQKLELE